jgi:hypothetical protein
MNTKQIKHMVEILKQNPEAEIGILKQNPEADVEIYLYTKQRSICFLWNFYRLIPIEMKVKKITSISNGDFKDYYIVDINILENQSSLESL